MNRFHKLISVLFHPILLPIAATIVFFILNNDTINTKAQLTIISTVAIGTYLVPLIMLFVLKRRKLIQNLEVRSINERKIPIIFMTVLFYILGKSFNSIENLIYLSQLFLGSSLALSICYFLLLKNLKISLHMIGIASFISFVTIYSIQTKSNITLFLAILFLLAGIIANARLKLKEHSLKELSLGFLTGICSQILIFAILWL